MLPIEEFSIIVDKTPLVSIDLLVSYQNRYLLGKRSNAPAQGFWFVPGGRIFKNEKIDDALGRIAKKEIGIDLKEQETDFLGIYEHFYNNSFCSSEITTHYVVAAYHIIKEIDIKSLPNNEHESYKQFEVNEILNNEYVHQYTKNYFRSYHR
ncbi:GDP-mannose mannosyl hydrolase [Marinospirillum minutulum]|uniref:GDP-mannose mannosyl hydrolase n=1 Tax=Marinospirillum minutulum TaxID=64974 RepID=UPI0004841FA0|nr:GDP-mannose mannosyl hydrolase [Marinospirillum minutulum]